MRKKYKQIDNRNKAFLGAIIGAVGAIGGAIAGAKAKRKQQQAQLEAARINAQNQQNQINANLQMQQDAVDAQYQQQLAEVEAQEKLNQEQNALTKQKVGIQSAQSLTNAFSNTNELNKEFNSRFARMGTRRKMKKCGGRTKANFGTTSLASMAKTPSIPTKINANYGNAGTFGSLNASQKFNIIGNKIGSGLGMIGQGIQGFNTGYNLGQMFKCGGRRKAKYGKDGISTALSNRDKIQYDLNDLKRRLGIIKSGNFGGGDFGGAGTGNNIDDYKEPRIIEKTDTIYAPVTTTFNDAFKKAIIDGESEFEFNGKKYTTEISDDPRWKEYGDKRTSTVIVPIERKRKIKTYDNNTIMKCGGRKKAANGTAINMGNGNWKLDYSGRVQYHNPVVADLEVVNDQAQSYSGNTPGQNTAQYAGVNSVATMQTAGQSPSNAVNAAITANTYQNRYGCGGKCRMKRRK